MLKIITKSTLIFLFFLTSNCGYKTLDNSEINNFHMVNIQTIGNKRINFKIKNNLIVNSSKNKINSLALELNTKKTKTIKEKNIKNEITKYEISLKSIIKLNFLENNEEKQFTATSTGNYSVGDKYSKTLRNEKRLIDDLTSDLSKQILSRIKLLLNDI